MCKSEIKDRAKHRSQFFLHKGVSFEKKKVFYKRPISIPLNLRLMKLSTLAVSGLLLLAAGCQKPAEEASPATGGSGSGSTYTAETRKPGVFRSVVLQTASRLTVRRDENCFVQLAGPANALAGLRAELDGESLILKYTPGTTQAAVDALQLEVHLPFLQTVTVSGSGRAVIEAGFNDSLEGFVNGSGFLQVLGGPFSHLHLGVTGSGTVDAQEAQSRTADVQVNGTGKIRVKTSDKLVARIDGTGTVAYYGSPSVTVNGNGAQGLVQMGGQNLQGIGTLSE